MGLGELVAAGGSAEGFVADAKNHDSKEGDYERKCRADMPLAEDNAEVCCVPGEEHLVNGC